MGPRGPIGRIGQATELDANGRLLRFLSATAEEQEAIDQILGLAPRPPAPRPLEGQPPAPKAASSKAPGNYAAAATAGPGATAEPFITKAEMARRLNRDVRTMTTWMRRGLVPYYKIAHTVVFKWSEVEKQMAATCRVARPRF